MMEPPQARPLSITIPGVVATLFVFAVAAVCVRLGFWQLERLGERRERNAALTERLSSEPAPLRSSLNDTTDWTYRRVVLEGTYDEDRLIVYAGRSLRTVPGVHVLTPLRLEETGEWLLVNRGWMPAADAASPDLEAIETSGPVRATGIVVPFPGGRSPPAPAAKDSDGRAFRRTWFSIDSAAIRAQFPYALGAVTVQLLPEESAPELPVRLQPAVLDEGPHRGYAIQWFSFAAIAIIGWAAMVMKSGSRSRGVARGSPASH
jgi:surfeit locus 1 family protein